MNQTIFGGLTMFDRFAVGTEIPSFEGSTSLKHISSYLAKCKLATLRIYIQLNTRLTKK